MVDTKIAIVKKDVYEYPQNAPFRPDTRYPEAIFHEISSEENPVYNMVRDCFLLAGYDSENNNTPFWNPLGGVISPGQTVLIKPNLVMDKNGLEGGGTDCLYTQPSVVAPVIDYVCIALKGTGKIVIGDAPMQECDFETLIEKSGYKQMIQFYKDKGIDIELVDFRELSSVVKNGLHEASIRKDAKGKIVNLGKNSEFYGDSEAQLKNMRVTNYDPRILPQHHTGETHEYYISDYVLNADVVINMPKPKSHRKAGVTIALKNLVGINVRKEFLPHHTLGPLKENGDEYLNRSILHKMRSRIVDRMNVCVSENHRLQAQLCRVGRKVCSMLMRNGEHPYVEGSWYGNHTISRTISDLNKILLYADKNGIVRDIAQRKVLIIADMIISGEKEGPVEPTPKEIGIIAAGKNPVAFDMAVSSIMGFDFNKIPTIEVARSTAKLPLVQQNEVNLEIASNDGTFDGKTVFTLRDGDNLGFIPTSGWKGHIEL